MMDWVEYNERFVSPAIKRAADILKQQGKADTYTVADIDAAIKQAASELQLHAQIVNASPEIEGWTI